MTKEATVVKETLKLGEKEYTKEEMRVSASESYRSMQLSWFEFSKCIFGMHETTAFLDFGYDNFKEFCVNEYKDIEYSTVIKFVHIYRDFGESIEKRLIDSPELALPSYSSFYELSVAKKRLPSAKLTKLKKAVLDQKLSYRKLREEIKEQTQSLLESEKSKLEKAEDSAKKAEDQLYEDIKDKKMPEVVEASTDDAASYLDENDSVDGEESKVLVELIAKMDSLMANILERKEVTDEVIELGNKLEELSERIDKFLNNLENI